MHKCDFCKEVGNIYAGRTNKYYCGDCFAKYYKILKPIKAEVKEDRHYHLDCAFPMKSKLPLDMSSSI